ncbi:MAG: T9SS type A sorting domain-containing protein [Prevotellaceae bacterium]|jgi:hypothetical protein|nr:T9SS type A sorting domain-containing protein [Prevotellaceae bacterium]
MKKIIFLAAAIVLFCTINLVAQTHTVTLKVIDLSAGARTNNVDDNNETNMICWISDNIKAENPRSTDDWWFPMYNNSGITPDGMLLKNPDNWTWQITLNAPIGTHRWNPLMKTLGSAELNKRILYYGDDNQLEFTVAQDGTVTGTTEVVVSNEQFAVTLKVTDQSAGAKTDPNNMGNTIFLESGDIPDFFTRLYDEAIAPTTNGNWWYTMYPNETDGIHPEGNPVQKTETEWIWSTVVNVRSGCWGWIPSEKTGAEWKKINDAMYVYNPENPVLQFNVATDGTVTGITELVIPGTQTEVQNIDNKKIKIYSNKNCITIESSEILKSAELFTIDGKNIYFNNNFNNNQLIINDLPQGIYFVRIDGKTYKIINN